MKKIINMAAACDIYATFYWNKSYNYPRVNVMVSFACIFLNMLNFNEDKFQVALVWKQWKDNSPWFCWCHVFSQCRKWTRVQFFVTLEKKTCLLILALQPVLPGKLSLLHYLFFLKNRRQNYVKQMLCWIKVYNRFIIRCWLEFSDLTWFSLSHIK